MQFPCRNAESAVPLAAEDESAMAAAIAPAAAKPAPDTAAATAALGTEEPPKEQGGIGAFIKKWF